MSDNLPHADNPGGTHYDGCWQDRGHHNCAVLRVRELQADNERLREEVKRLIAFIHDEDTEAVAIERERDKYKSEADSLKEWKNSLEEYRLTPKYGGWYELGIESSGDRVFVEREIK